MCPVYISEELSIEKTLLDTCMIFHIMGATYGINYVLKNISNPYYWHVTDLKRRLLRGVTGFIFHYALVALVTRVYFDFVTEYAILAAVNCLSGFVCYGLLPVIFDYLGMTNSEMSEEVKRKYLTAKMKLLK